jgi:hypothetical protein
MSTDQAEFRRKKQPHVLTFAPGGLPSAQVSTLFEILAGPGMTSGPHAGPSPMAVHTSSIFADNNICPWMDKGNECYTGTAKIPLILLQFKGFDEGDYLILTLISWRMTIRSTADGYKDAHIILCSNGADCKKLSAGLPKKTATMYAYDGAKLQTVPGTPPAPIKERRKFLHQVTTRGLAGPPKDGNLREIVLNVGKFFTATFHASNTAKCGVEIGVPEIFSLQGRLDELYK